MTQQLADTLRIYNFHHYVAVCTVGFAIGFLILATGWFAVVLVAIVGAALIVLTRPIILCYVVVFAIAVGSGIERGRLVPILTVNEIVLVCTAGVTVLILLLDKRRRYDQWQPYWFVSFLLIGFDTVLIPLGLYMIRGTSLNLQQNFKLVAPIQFLLLFLPFAVLPQHDEERRRLIVSMMLGSALIAFVGILQAVGFKPVIDLLATLYPSSLGEMAEETGRVTSLLGAWNALGILLMVSLLLGWALLPTFQNGGQRLVMIGSMLLCAMCLIASGSFAGTFCLIVGIIILEAMSGRGLASFKRLILGAFGVGLLILISYPLLEPLISERLGHQYGGGQDGILPETFVYRIYVWKEVFIPPIIENFPWAIAPDVPAHYAWHYEESQYIMLQFRTGFVSLSRTLLSGKRKEMR
ncbi:hypothetical protein KFU94_71295 [Chloroflexi bacterium TSY]|nr:hypothetical protein [Chloroflexi bacterium TSY]